MPLERIRLFLLSMSSSLGSCASSSSRSRSSRFRFSSSRFFFFLSLASMMTSGGGGSGGASAASSSESSTLRGAYFRKSSKLSEVSCFCCLALKMLMWPRMRFRTSVATLPFKPSMNFLCATMSKTGPVFTLPSLAARSALYNHLNLSFGFFGNTSSQFKLMYSSLTCATSSLDTFFLRLLTTSPGTRNISSSLAFLSSGSSFPHFGCDPSSSPMAPTHARTLPQEPTASCRCCAAGRPGG
mmetsp:Transcript_47739/g.153692  ORF Transcript_47739/g.153692 Transcript_47739/m.153692 type:complete len:241 (+) Transcript_47739:374-1096(+)